MDTKAISVLLISTDGTTWWLKPTFGFMAIHITRWTQSSRGVGSSRTPWVIQGSILASQLTSPSKSKPPAGARIDRGTW